MIPVCVKWNKQTYEKVEIDTNKPVADFKNTLLSLTNVPIERQKLMAKGGWIGILKDDADWKTCKLTEGMTVLLMGTADVAPEPMQVVAQEESKADNLKADESQILHYPIGMMNTGNTCYLNSVLQSLRFIPEFTDILSAPGIAGNSRLLNILGQVFQVMKSSKNAIPPVPFIQELRNRFPQFAEMRNGHYAQQDADELFSCIATELQNTTSSSPAATGAGNCFSFDVDAAYSCVESNEEPPLHLVETMNKLTCNIQGGTDKIRIDNLYEGLKLSFECQIEKFSSVLNRDANWMKKQKLLTLPNCLCIHFVRFFWKAFPEKNSNGQTGTKCKILRPILYPEVFILFLFRGSFLYLIFVDS
jgi:ubiquitin carboxyl-terminal hydrolase 14